MPAFTFDERILPSTLLAVPSSKEVVVRMVVEGAQAAFDFRVPGAGTVLCTLQVTAKDLREIAASANACARYIDSIPPIS